ncbi:hypothetical protein DCCM_3619 [Desulfocucumis palustris]|uniref:Uncharacterized protein n=1 Tax=Desulfocucumis palustris TaxID=1898651 RepID=A0A2L2XKP8_9FIRM|nr:hypothetical protein DCCM_3619 [Desulfocucumis palustris]
MVNMKTMPAFGGQAREVFTPFCALLYLFWEIGYIKKTKK